MNRLKKHTIRNRYSKPESFVSPPSVFVSVLVSYLPLAAVSV